MDTIMLKIAVSLMCLTLGLYCGLRNWHAAFAWLIALLLAIACLAPADADDAGLSYEERQRIAIKFMCDPVQSWKGMSSFCGSQVLDGKHK